MYSMMRAEKKTALVARMRLIPLLGLIGVTCGGALPYEEFSPPSADSLVSLGTWAPSGALRFRIIKVEETKLFATPDDTLRAGRARHYIIVTLQAIPVTKGEARVYYVENTRLVDRQGRGYKARAEDFTRLNPGNLPVEIKSGWFAEKRVPFLIPDDFSPFALRCQGSADAQPCLLGLRRMD